ncbi:MAG: bifunctional DNA-formamidopyrimidine glycosylase/DNA-(apurinic or apyrimidinic site) lyase [Bdellovibrionota bacterium]|nr:bifunctional DNA-formamidopyrimidine glycosylase/DNA-(apurinic or apyrimidinic site) lyase [Bdellovibrionota bacterium]
MPELPEVETVKRGIIELVGEKTLLKKLELKRQDLRFPIPSDIVRRFKNVEILQITRRAKYLMFHTPKGILVSHLGMTGTWREKTKNEILRTHDHILMHLKDKVLIYNDPRRFGSFEYCGLDQLESFVRFKHLGPEPLDEERFNFEYLWKKSRKKELVIKNFIMDQRVVVGVGNIYAAEALFLSAIKPTRKTKSITKKEMERLIDNIRLVLESAIEAGGSSISDFKQAGGESGYFQNHFNVYGREGQACFVCSSIIKNINLGGRSSFYCPHCQV